MGEAARAQRREFGVRGRDCTAASTREARGKPAAAPMRYARIVKCPACEYQNPDSSPVCLDCGAALSEGGSRRARERFVESLESAQLEAREKLRRASRGAGRRDER